MAESPFDTRGFSRHEYRIRGIRTVVYATGSGPPVMYWHGRGTWHGFAWARALGERFQLWLPYHPGFGESGDDPTIASADGYSRHYIELLDHLRLPQVALIGASFGGYLAANFTRAHPARVSKLVLASPFGLSSPDIPRVNYRDVPFESLPDLFVVDRRAIAPFWPDRWNERIAREQAAGARALAGSIVGDAWARTLASIHHPTLILWGRNDRLLPADLARLWQQTLPHARVQIVDNAGHLLLDESATARAELLSFLN
jgi:pimeloyl-ACP methyl ester carboxylesterase